MKALDSRYDTVIIGGGLAGLTAAAYLARAKQKVALLERAGELGGRARTERFDGFAMNLGAHAIYREGAAHRAFAELEVAVPGRFVDARGAYAIRGGALHTLPSGPVSLLATGLLPLGAKLELARVLTRVQHEAARVGAEETMAEWTARSASSEPARALLAALVRVATYGSSPEHTSARAGVRQVAHALASGVEYVDGGWASLVEGLRDRVLASGGELHTGVRATAVQGGRVELADGRSIAARSVIVAVPPRGAAELFAGETRARLERFLAGAVPVVAACLDVALSSTPRPRAAFALGIDTPIYVSVHSRVARLAPEGGALIHTLRYGAPGEPVAAAAVERELEAAIDLLQPGWREVIVRRRFLPHMVVAHAAIPPAGGAAHPAVDLPVEEGVFLAGDYVGDRWMLADASVASGKDAASLALARSGHAVERAA